MSTIIHLMMILNTSSAVVSVFVNLVSLALRTVILSKPFELARNSKRHVYTLIREI